MFILWLVRFHKNAFPCTSARLVVRILDPLKEELAIVLCNERLYYWQNEEQSLSLFHLIFFYQLIPNMIVAIFSH